VGTNVHVKRPNGRSTASGRGHKGLVDQEKTFQQRQNDEAIKQRGIGNVLLDRWLATKAGSAESRTALDKLKAERAA
jgi:hypothetical protein